MSIPKLTTLFDKCLDQIHNKPRFHLDGHKFTDEEKQQWEAFEKLAMWRLIEDTRDKLAEAISVVNKHSKRLWPEEKPK